MDKKSIALLLIIVLTISSLAGCADNETASNETTIKYDLSQEEINEISEVIEASEASEASTDEVSTTVSEEELQLADGVYTGSADAFGPDLTVEVTVADGLISNIAIVSHNEENSAIYGEAMEVIPVQIVETQSIEVDAVSGATYTSYGIKNAVIDALGDALISGELPEQTEISSSGKGHGH